MVDSDLVLRKLSELDTFLAQLNEFRGVTVAQYKADWKVQRIVERTLQMIVELCSDIAGHIIAARSLPVATSYANTYEVLGQGGLLAPDLTATMVKIAKFRNVVVHQYADVDADIVVGILRDHLGDIARYRDAVLAVVKADAS